MTNGRLRLRTERDDGTAHAPEDRGDDPAVAANPYRREPARGGPVCGYEAEAVRVPPMSEISLTKVGTTAAIAVVNARL